MADIKGYIYDIHIVNDMVAQIVLRGKDGNKTILRSFTVIGYWKDKALKEMKLKVKDRIAAKYYIESNFVESKGRYYTDIKFKEISLLRRAPDNKQRYIVDKETGEILE